jgi:hypothetical protein
MGSGAAAVASNPSDSPSFESLAPGSACLTGNPTCPRGPLRVFAVDLDLRPRYAASNFEGTRL